MKNNKMNFRLMVALVIAVTGAAWLGSCNKPIPQATPIVAPALNPGTIQSIGLKIQIDPNYSIYLAAVKRVGLLDTLTNEKRAFTVFLPDNTAFAPLGITSPATIGVLPLATVAGIVQYSIVGGQVTSAMIDTFPNVQLPTYLKIADITGTPLSLRMSICPRKLGNSYWVNNIPITVADERYTNGTVYKVAVAATPPTALLKNEIYGNPDLLYFKNAIARADSGQVGTSKLDSILGYAVMNTTVLAPNNAAFQQVIYAMSYSYLVGTGLSPLLADAQATALASDPNVFSNPALFGVLTASTVKGILAYHFLTAKAVGYQPFMRAFSNDFATPSSFCPTLVNNSIPVHPGILVKPTYTGSSVTGITFTGYGTFPTGGTPFTMPAANAVQWDKNCVNGVYYIIDKILLPQ